MAATALKQRKLQGKALDTPKLHLPLTTRPTETSSSPRGNQRAGWKGFLGLLLLCLLLLTGMRWGRDIRGGDKGLAPGLALADVPYATFPYASPRLPTSTDTDQAAAPQPPLLHFVHTRFLQEQGPLEHLAWARLFLFETVCFPTMRAQSTDAYLWLIRMDPQLDARVFERLRRLVEDYDHIYLVASNRNFRIQNNNGPHASDSSSSTRTPDGWRDGGQGADLAASRIYSGNLARLEAALAHVHTATLVETRLDADDGLHVDYLRTLQDLVRTDFGDNNNNNNNGPRWKYWCARRHLAWHWSAPSLTGESPGDDANRGYGSLVATQHDHLCITPGLSVAFRVGVNEADVPVFAHHELVYQLSLRRDRPSPESLCGASACWEFIQGHAMDAIRSRTPTSAGMAAVVASQKEQVADPDAWLTFAYWDIVHDSFDVSRNDLRWMQAYLTRHLAAIVQDNLQGQCTTGHSCKPEAKRDLEALLELAEMMDTQSSLDHV